MLVFRSGFGLLATKDGQPLVPNGENRYHAIFGGGPAYFVSPSSLGPALIAARREADGSVRIRQTECRRREVLHRTQGGHRSRSRSQAERNTYGNPDPGGCGHQERNLRNTRAGDARLAVSHGIGRAEDDGSTISSAKVVLGHVAPTPWVATAAAQFLTGKSISEATAEQAGAEAVKDAKPLSQNAYKVQLAKVAVKRALLAAAGRA